VIPIVVEGDADVPVAQRLLGLVGLEVGSIYGLHGKDWLDENVARYNKAARFSRWFVLRDLNGDAPCAGELIGDLLRHPARHMCFRVAVRASEAWLLADRAQIAEFLGLQLALIPTQPDHLADPKREMVNLARRSRRRVIRADMVPDTKSTARVGPAYSARIIEFALEKWRPETAAATSPSLARCIAALQHWT
jgi:hypothetical protein